MKQSIENYIKKWESNCYYLGIPDEAPISLESIARVPSYRNIVKAILKNDVALQTLGMQRKKCEAYILLKRQELEKRNKSNQLKIEL